MRIAKRRENEARLTAFFDTLRGELECVPSSPAVERLKTRMRKRAGYHRPALANEAIEKFVAINNEVGSLELAIPKDVVENAKHFIRIVLERFTTRENPLFIQEVLDSRLLYDRWRFGPGASNGVTGTHTVEKLLQKMTVTSSCVPWLHTLRKSNPYFASFDRGNGDSGMVLVNGSRLTTVPKNEDTVRTIAVEPLGNMALQLAAGRYLEDALRMIGLDISTQEAKNKHLAYVGSKDGSIATIDLSSASDRISLQLIRLLYPKEWVTLLEALRSPMMTLPDGREIELNMVSTMGNGFTFPLMTLTLVSLIYGLRSRNTRSPTLWVDWSETCVYGDDIIVPVHEYKALCEILQSAGLVVNLDKSYCEGPFRESCGGDYYEGVDITPFYVENLSCDPEIYVAINKLMDWSAPHGILLYKSVIYLLSLVEQVRLVPEWHNPDEGILSSQCRRRYTYLRAKPPRVRIREDHPFMVMLACGGYIEADRLGVFYTPRPVKIEWYAKSARIPNGYLDGADPVKRPVKTTEFVANYSFIFE